jgi:hypothetical protein
MGMVDGLWVGGHEAATDFALITYQLRLLGYNAVRLPFTWRDLTMAPKDLVKECTAVSPDQLKRRLISPNVVDKYINMPLPGNVSPQRKRQPGFCNQYLPMRSNYHRLLFVAQSFIAQGMYVVLDYQPQGLEQQPYSLSTFVSQWTDLWKMVACLPNFDSDIANRIFVDIMNEPDSMGIRWESNGGRPGAAQLYLATADSLWGLTPNKLLFMFEGTGQNGYGLNCEFEGLARRGRRCRPGRACVVAGVGGGTRLEAAGSRNWRCSGAVCCSDWPQPAAWHSRPQAQRPVLCSPPQLRTRAPLLSPHLQGATASSLTAT